MPLAVEGSLSNFWLCLERWQNMQCLKPSCGNPPAYIGISEERGMLYPAQHLGIIHHKGTTHKTSHSGCLIPFQMRRIWFQVLDMEAEYAVTHFLRNMNMGMGRIYH